MLSYRLVMREAVAAQQRSAEWHDFGRRCEKTPSLMPSRILAQSASATWANRAQTLVAEARLIRALSITIEDRP